MPARKDKLIKANAKGKYPTLTRFRVELCPDELTMVWHDSGMAPADIRQAIEYQETQIPKHTMSRIVFETMQVVRLRYNEPPYLG